MTIALTVVVLVAVVIVAAQLAERLGIQPPLFLLGVGVIACLVPGVPVIELSPEVVLLGLLPPLLYAAALSTSLVDIRANLGSILSLAFGLVLFTALIVGAITHYVLDVHWGVAIALGAIVAPPDAVAATAVARRVGLPRRVTTILEGESLLNDATSLVTLRTALAAAGLAVAHGEGAATHPEPVGPADVAQSFAVAVVGGVAVGVVVFLLVGWLRRRVHESAADTALSFVAPFAAYLPAEEIGASGVLAVVTAGLLLAHKAPLLQTASSRLSERINWASITFILENLVFLLIGLQVKAIITAVREDDVALGNAFLLGLAVLVAAMIARPLWLLPMTWLRRVVGR
ncbi:MAG: cation:proton antiporter, partial [Tetrasphaera sp.]|nr:cation:proton antiporter [Tetrasphaera sp.]